MCLMTTKRYRQATSALPKILSEYSRLFFFVFVFYCERKLFKVWKESFLTLLLKIFKLYGSLSHIYSFRNKPLSHPWYIDFTSSLDNSELSL